MRELGISLLRWSCETISTEFNHLVVDNLHPRTQSFGNAIGKDKKLTSESFRGIEVSKRTLRLAVVVTR